ncbi:MAG TPA: bifunctional uridylyltransferase/uridylyl-removing protein, partial [Deltaproteobacteria bacterium]|nr:bifunctional uridylyltransferase/uridylyl-removing protein [Deltaproteobacteria bacterium]
MNGFELTRKLTKRVDSTILSLASGLGNAGGSWCIIAAGGYGRRELCPHSDIDILVLSREGLGVTTIDRVLRHIVYPLWDMGIAVSHSVRTPSQVLSDIKDDFFFRTSLFDARFIAGDTSVFKIMETLQRSEILGRDLKGLVKEIGDGVRRRHQEFGDSSYLLEPDIKDAIGGLRDYHAVRWILKA